METLLTIIRDDWFLFLFFLMIFCRLKSEAIYSQRSILSLTKWTIMEYNVQAIGDCTLEAIYHDLHLFNLHLSIHLANDDGAFYSLHIHAHTYHVQYIEYKW